MSIGVLLAAFAFLADAGVTSASSVVPGASPAGAVDGDRFACELTRGWKGEPGQREWWWRIDWPATRSVGAILQINGDEPTMLRNAPRRYVWQVSDDGTTWSDLAETSVSDERRTFRLHRLTKPVSTAHLRLLVRSAQGTAPTLREAEFYAETDARVAFPEWMAAVSTVEDPANLKDAMQFVALAKVSPGGEGLQAQRVWIDQFDEEFIRTEPRPLCAFLTGNYRDWCQREREPWRGVERVLKSRRLPMWASCGGAQALAILEEVGVDRPWDCPRCRDANAPKLPIYTHIGHTGPSPCGVYDKNIAERGKYALRKEGDDPAFAGLPELFDAMESHVGQIAYAPDGWVRVVTKGPIALTENQCLRVSRYPIYAAQFHIEMAGTPETSRRIMANFLGVARDFNRAGPASSSGP